LSPLFLVLTACLFMTGFFRGIYLGLRSHSTLLLYFSIAALAFVVSLGPIVKLYGNQHLMINPITTLLYYLFPGFSSIRAVSRMASLIPLGLAITSGIGYMLMKERLSNPVTQKAFSFIVLGFLMLEAYPTKGINTPYMQAESELPGEYVWLKQAEAGPVLEWPLHYPFAGDGVYLERSMEHQKKLINGYASFQWDGHKKLSRLKDLKNKNLVMRKRSRERPHRPIVLQCPFGSQIHGLPAGKGRSK